MYFIFHTSYCGSTYLACLLSESIETFSEPDWSNELSKLKIEKNCLVKIPSRHCYFSNKLENKKIFLYRPLKNHLSKIKNKNANSPDCVTMDMINNIQVMQGNLHRKTKLNGCFFNNDLLKNQTILWIDRFNWLLDTENVYFLNMKNFILNRDEELKKICNFLSIKYIPTEEKIYFDVKLSDYNVKNEKIKIGLNKKHIVYNENKTHLEEKFDAEIEELLDKVNNDYMHLQNYII